MKKFAAAFVLCCRLALVSLMSRSSSSWGSEVAARRSATKPNQDFACQLARCFECHYETSLLLSIKFLELAN